MKTLLAAAFLTSAAHAAPAPLIRLQLAPSAMDQAAGKGEVKVRMTIPRVDAPAGAPLFGRAQGRDFTVTDSQGPVPRAEGKGGGWTPARPVKGEITVSYTAGVGNSPSNGGTTPIFPRIDGQGFSGIGMTLLAIPDLKTPYRIKIDWDLKAMGPDAAAVSSWGDGDVEMKAGPVSRLAHTVFMAGKLHREPAKTTGRFAAVWSGDPGFDLKAPMAWTETLHGYMLKFFDTPNDPAYRVFLRANGGGNVGGGVAFPNSFFFTYGPGVTGENAKSILGHEMVHTFTANELGRWYVEGDAVFYQVQLPWRAGLATTEQYLADINETAQNYYTNAEIHASDDKVDPAFFSNMWLNSLSYDRGAIYFATLNGMIRDKTAGKRSIDDLVRIMVKKQRADETITNQTWVDLLREEIGEDAVKLHDGMMSGEGLLVPASDAYGPCFQRVGAKVRRFDLGFKEKRNADGKSEVADLVAGSEADKAGVRNGDLVTITPRLGSAGPRRDPTARITLTGLRGGQPIAITYLPRGAAIDAYQWERKANVPESACRP